MNFSVEFSSYLNVRAAADILKSTSSCGWLRSLYFKAEMQVVITAVWRFVEVRLFGVTDCIKDREEHVNMTM